MIVSCDCYLAWMIQVQFVVVLTAEAVKISWN